MASAFWNESKGKWYAKFKNSNGQHVSTPITGQVVRTGPNPPSGRGFLTKKQAEARAAEMEREADELRRGVRQEEKNETFNWMVTFHNETYGVNMASERADSFFEKHLRECKLSGMRMRDIRKFHIREFMESKKDVLGPESINKLRDRIYKVISLAAERELCHLHPNKVEPLEVPKRADEYLRFHEVGPTFGQLRKDIQGLFWTTTELGLRKQEPLHIRKEDVNMADGTVLIRKTKTSAERTLPIPGPLRSVFEEAMKTPGPWLFPDPTKNGGQYRSESKFDRLLRTAMGKAGFVRHYKIVCRRKGCGFQDTQAEAKNARCPKCNFRLSVYGVARHVRFHDLRHTTGSLLAKLGVPIEVIAKILGHADINMTRRYLAVDMDDMRKGLSKLTDRLGLSSDIASENQPEVQSQSTPLLAVAGIGTGFGFLMVSDSNEPKSEAHDSEKSPVESRALASRGERIRTSDPLRPRRVHSHVQGLARGRNPLEAFSSSGRTESKPLPGVAGNSTGFGFLMVSGSADCLLTVRQVAKVLNVSTATVYSLCARGAIPHTRVSDAIRVHPDDLRAFLTGGAR